MKIQRLKYVAILLSATMLCTLSGCSGNNSEVSENVAEADRQDVQSDTVTTETSEKITSENSSDTASKEDLTFPIGMALNGGSFTGTAYLAPMIANEEIYNFPQTNNVTFEPGARSGWHSHGGMIIIVTGGIGYYQEESQPAQIIRAGDVIECAEGVKHWHGAVPNSWFSQVVIYDSHYTDDGGAEEPVTDEQYENLVTEEYSINNWHTHAGGQILIATDGIGYHQIECEQERKPQCRRKQELSV